MSKVLIAVLAGMTMAVFAQPALAWEGASVDLVSCPELHLTLPEAPGPWKVQAREGVATTYADYQKLPLLYERQIPAHTGPTTIGNFYLAEGGPHIVTVAVGNATDMRDGFVTSQPTQMLDCDRPFYLKTEVYTRVETETIIINKIREQTRCVGRATRTFHLRRAYEGHRITAARAYEPGFSPTVRWVNFRGERRIRIAWSTRGKTFTAGGVLRTMNVRSTLADGTHRRMVWLWRPCVGRDGNPNDPSAAGNHGNAP